MLCEDRLAGRQVAAGFEEHEEEQQPRPSSSAQSTEPRARSILGIYVAHAPDMQSCIEQWELIQKYLALAPSCFQLQRFTVVQCGRPLQVGRTRASVR